MRHGFDPWVGKILWSRKRQLISVFLPGKFHGQRSLAGKARGVTKSWTWLRHWIHTYKQSPQSENVSCSVLSNSLGSHGLQPTRRLCPWNSPGKNTGVGNHSLLQGIFPTQGSNPGLLLCRQILQRLSHQRGPWLLEWAAYPSPGDLPDPEIELGFPALQVDFLPAELPRNPHL